MGRDPVRRRPDRRRAGQRQPGLPAPRARGRPGDGRRGDARRRQPVQRLELRGDGRVALPRGGRGDVARLVVGPLSPPEATDRAGRPARARAGGPGPTWSRRPQRVAASIWRRAPEPPEPTDVHNIQFTSGTTGLPKGAMLTHRNVLMNAYYTGERLRYSAADRVCVPVPFYHCFGCVLGTMVVRGLRLGDRRAGPVVRRRRDAGGDRRRALHVGLRRADHVRGSARASRFRALRPDEPAHRHHVGCSLSACR